MVADGWGLRLPRDGFVTALSQISSAIPPSLVRAMLGARFRREEPPRPHALELAPNPVLRTPRRRHPGDDDRALVRAAGATVHADAPAHDPVRVRRLRGVAEPGAGARGRRLSAR